jgi:hypothetical protein
MNIRVALAFLCVLSALLLVQNRIDLRNFRKRGLDIAGYSYSAGCFAEARNVCGKLYDIPARSGCYEEAYSNCPILGEKFKKTLEHAGKEL